MAKITFIGAGSLVFTYNLCSDVLLTPALQNSTIVLMDIDPARLEQVRQVIQFLIDRRGVAAQLITTTDQREAVQGADYVITTFQQGGLDAYTLDIEIPQRYGVEQCVGDTLGPGGIFRALRTIPVLLNLCRDMDDCAPDALLLNYVNPMAANCWAVDRGSGRPHVGLCHSVQGTSEMLARWLDVPYSEVNYVCAGINHQAFFLSFRQHKDDLYPRLREVIERDDIYGEEPVRIDLMRHFGYFVTESSGHASEYAPYFRKTAKMVNEDLVPRFKNPGDGWFDFGRTGGYLRHCLSRLAHADADFEAVKARETEGKAKRSHEYGVSIINAIETHEPVSINGNLPNRGLISNLPEGCCVEVACLVNGAGIQPTRVGNLPPQLAGLNRTNINVQEMIVEAALTGRVEAVYQALALDPLTGAVCDLRQIRQMGDEMLAAQTQWLPQFSSRM
jgi:alpha-galactosidase